MGGELLLVQGVYFKCAINKMACGHGVRNPHTCTAMCSEIKHTAIPVFFLPSRGDIMILKCHVTIIVTKMIT